MLDVELVEQLMILCLDSSPWETYPFQPILERLVKQAPRTHFRAPRADKGKKRPAPLHGAGRSKGAPSTPAPLALLYFPPLVMTMAVSHRPALISCLVFLCIAPLYARNI